VILSTESTSAVGSNLHQLLFVRTNEEERVIGHLGPDLLDPDWSPTHAAEAAARLARDPTRELGLALLDQTLMAGIGNVYKAEVCFLLGVSPWTPVSDVDVPRIVELSRDLLLRNALNPNRNTTGDPGRNRNLWVYGRHRTGCLRCGGRVVATGQGTDVQERITYYCPNCQPGPHP
jgi:endonuclease-8